MKYKIFETFAQSGFITKMKLLKPIKWLDESIDIEKYLHVRESWILMIEKRKQIESRQK